MGNVEMAAQTPMIEKQEELLKVWEPLLEMISKLLKDDHGRATTDEGLITRHGLAFMEMEVSTIVASLKIPLQRQPSRDSFALSRRMSWLKSRLGGEVEAFMKSLYSRHWHGGEAAPCVLLLLKKAMRCFCPRPLDDSILWMAYKLYREVAKEAQLEYPRSSIPSSPPDQVVEEAGGLHDQLVGIDGQVEELLRWIMAADDKSLRVMAITGPTGVGKTTLAMELHRRLQSQAEQYCFQCCVVAKFYHQSKWPQPSGSYFLLKTMLSQIIDLEAPSTYDDAELARRVSERLKERR
uniref:Orc1-like AAA ATPase domain-containing protein n=1 Tax=Leersia perrieri TaxID=77586 RepID=A0A0D9XTY0_9ORYZ